jgi:hypothetical protein
MADRHWLIAKEQMNMAEALGMIETKPFAALVEASDATEGGAGRISGYEKTAAVS